MMPPLVAWVAAIALLGAWLAWPRTDGAGRGSLGAMRTTAARPGRPWPDEGAAADVARSQRTARGQGRASRAVAEEQEDAAREELARVAALLRSGASGPQAWSILARTTRRREWAEVAAAAATALAAGEEVPSRPATRRAPGPEARHGSGGESRPEIVVGSRGYPEAGRRWTSPGGDPETSSTGHGAGSGSTGPGAAPGSAGHGAEVGRAWPVAAWACSMASRTGAPLAPLLDRVAEDAGARADASRARTAGEAGARSTRRILAWLPVGGVVLAQMLGADPLGVLTGTLGGRIAALLGLALWVAALTWSGRILAHPTRAQP